jgi:hypothetical protein
MRVIKALAWTCFWLIGFFVWGTVAALAGGAWVTVFLIWMGFWGVVGVLAELAEPNTFLD